MTLSNPKAGVTSPEHAYAHHSYSYSSSSSDNGAASSPESFGSGGGGSSSSGGGGGGSADGGNGNGNHRHHCGYGANLNGFTRLPVSDLWLFGVHPMREPLRLGICHKCGQRVLAAALPKHAEQCKIPKKKWKGTAAAEGGEAAAGAAAGAGKGAGSNSGSHDNAAGAADGGGGGGPALTAAVPAAAHSATANVDSGKVGTSRPQKRVTAPPKRSSKHAKTTTDGADKPGVPAARTHTDDPDLGEAVTSGPGYVIVLEPIQTPGTLVIRRGSKVSEPSPLSWRDRAQLRLIMDAEAEEEGNSATDGGHGIVQLQQLQEQKEESQPALPVPPRRRGSNNTTSSNTAASKREKERVAVKKEKEKVAHKTPPPLLETGAATDSARLAKSKAEPASPPARTFKRRCPTPKCTGEGHRTGKFEFHFTVSGCPNAAKA